MVTTLFLRANLDFQNLFCIAYALFNFLPASQFIQNLLLKMQCSGFNRTKKHQALEIYCSNDCGRFWGVCHARVHLEGLKNQQRKIIFILKMTTMKTLFGPYLQFFLT